MVHATDHTGDDAYETEIALVKLRADLHERTEILQVAENFGAKVTDYGQDSLMLRVYGASEKLDAFIALLRPYGMRELVRSGQDPDGAGAAGDLTRVPVGAALRLPGAQSVAGAPKSVTPCPWRRTRSGPAADRDRLHPRWFAAPRRTWLIARLRAWHCHCSS